MKRFAVAALVMAISIAVLSIAAAEAQAGIFGRFTRRCSNGSCSMQFAAPAKAATTKPATKAKPVEAKPAPPPPARLELRSSEPPAPGE